MNLKNSLISVIMPAYNAGKYIEEAIQCILDQTYTSWELLICDDASTDDTCRIIKQYALKDSRIRFFRNEVNIGYLKTWNQLIEIAHGDFITFLDADDLCTADRIDCLYQYLTENPDIKVVGSNINVVLEGGEQVGSKECPVSPEIINQNLLTPNFPFCGSAVMIKKEVYRKVGGYREYFNRLGWEDHDWLIRCCMMFRAANVNRYLYSYRMTPDSVTRGIQPQDYKKLIIKKIGLELANQRFQSGTDCLDKGDYVNLNVIEKKYQKRFEDKPSLIYLILSATAPDKKTKRNYLFNAIKIQPFELRAYYHLFKSFWKK
jgi:glycosyltransferase involved in cell wall biosynthesis